jgi:hypothetical protein
LTLIENYKARKKDETKDKKEGGASAVTLKLDGIPSDLLLQLDGRDAPTWQCLDGHRTKFLGNLGWESWARGGLGLARCPGKSVLEKVPWERCRGKSVLGKVSWERRPGKSVLGKVFLEKCPGKGVVGKVS